MDIQRIRRKVQNRMTKADMNRPYLNALRKPINEKAFLLEAGQGKNINGNAFALLKYLRSQSRFDDFDMYLSLCEDVAENAKIKLNRYGIENVNIVITESDEYKMALATSKYLITDNSFPSYFVKRDGQVYLNTWHGTPLKALGRTDIDNSTSLANVQANMLKADYLLHPNPYTKDIMMRDYMVERLYKYKTVVLDYPRNDTLYREDYKEEILDKYNLHGKRLIAYMPTWRGSGRIVNFDVQIKEAEEIITQMDSVMKDDEILCVNLHFLLGNNIDVSGLEHTMMFPKEYETYDFLAVCDTLITDYSSVAVDFAGTGKEIVLYMYDYDDYNSSKGFYYDVRQFPFKQAFTFEEFEKELHSPRREYTLDEMFLADRGDSSRKLIELMVDGKEDGLDIQDYDTEPQTTLAYFEGIVGEMNQRLLDKYIERLTDEEKKHTVIAFQNRINQNSTEVLKRLDRDIDYIRIRRETYKDVRDYASTILYKRTGMLKNASAEFYKQESQRMFGSMNLKNIEAVQVVSIDKHLMITETDAHKVIYRLPSFFFGRNGDRLATEPDFYDSIISRYDEQKTLTEKEAGDIWDGLNCLGLRIHVPRADYDMDDYHLIITGKLSIASDMEIKPQETAVVSEVEYDIKLNGSTTKDKRGTYTYKADFELRIPLADMEVFNKQNRVYLRIGIGDGFVYTPLRRPQKGNLSSLPHFRINDRGTVCKVRTQKGYMGLEVRQENRTDSAAERRKLDAAYALHLATPAYKPILLYEKDCSRYEESASCVYEKLRDMGYKNAYFILDKDYPHKDSIPEKYRDGIIDRFSFQHYYNLFAAKTIISTEAISHSLELNSMSKLFVDHVLKGKQNYVFLQHGVMYMVSLNSEGRTFFRRSRPNQRVVVSSELEANHFTDYTNYEKEHVYVSGLPKFDKSVLSEGADRIVVMLTWRPWEYNQAAKDYTQTNYYRMLERIIDAVPEEYKNKLIVLPHPRIAELAGNDRSSKVGKYSIFDEKYDDILKRTRLLITDYSSISYDAFYRGSGIIFCWSEKDDCMKQYGPSTRLMLTEDLAFGPVSYDENIGDLIRTVYERGQTEEEQRRYGAIVQYHDGHNSERVINMMKEDGFI